jgi:hypothetical protein
VAGEDKAAAGGRICSGADADEEVLLGAAGVGGLTGDGDAGEGEVIDQEVDEGAGGEVRGGVEGDEPGEEVAVGEGRCVERHGRSVPETVRHDRALLQSSGTMENVYFALTEELNRFGRIAVLGSGQAVVWHRLAIMSKDGDWILRESETACVRVLDVLGARRARYRPGAPLDVRWLAGGWSSHFELFDERQRRVRCDFFTRPPRLDAGEIDALFSETETPAVVGIEPLVRMKQSQRAKDYAVIGELARRLPPERELELTTDPDRILALAPAFPSCDRPAARAARRGGRLDVVRTLAVEIDDLQRRDHARLAVFQRAAEPYFSAVARLDRRDLALPAGHRRLVELAEALLPISPQEAAS